MSSKIIYVLLLVVIIAFVLNKFVSKEEIRQGNIAPDFSTKLVDGSKFSLSELKGDYVLLDFWGSWCAPCLRDQPKLVALYNKYKDKTSDKGEGLRVVTIALEKNDKSWKRAADRFGFTWKTQIVEESRFVMLSDLAQKFKVTEVPSKFLISPEWKIISSNQPFEEIDRLLASRLQ